MLYFLKLPKLNVLSRPCLTQILCKISLEEIITKKIFETSTLGQRLADFAKSQMVNIFVIVDHTITVILTQLCFLSKKASIDNKQMSECGCVPIKVHLQK
jgi:hypothetical protein